MTEFMTADAVYTDCKANNVDDALLYLSDCGVELQYAGSAQEVYKAFCAREQEGTTGMVDGFAIPHAKSQAITKAGVAVVKFSGDVAWESMDEAPIRVAIALFVPENEAGTTHLSLLSKVAVMLMDSDFRAFIVDTDDKQSIAQEINKRLAE